MVADLEITAKAKINLTLDVLGKRQDGYHQVEMVMQTISLSDHITLENTTGTISLTCNHSEVPLNEENLAYQAAKLLQQQCNIKNGVKIHLEKHIPVAAGLAGGSTNAAAILKGLNQLWELGLTPDQLRLIGAKLGSDVPFCIEGGTALATGRGEQISPLKLVPEMHLVLVKPPFGVSTAQVYGNFRLEEVNRRPQTQEMLAAIRAGETQAIISHVANTLESVTLALYPQVALIKERLKQAGAKGVLMSGSGPTVFGFVTDETAGQEVASQLEDLGRIFVVNTCAGRGFAANCTCGEKVVQ